MRIAFFGTPTDAAMVLRKLVDAGHDIAIVVTQPDLRRSRRGDSEPTPVKAAAQDMGLHVTTEPTDAVDKDVDVGVLVAYGRLIRRTLLDAFDIVNIHPSLLPRWRGATPVESAILSGDEQSGVCLMKLVEEMDAGPLYAQRSVKLKGNERVEALQRHLFELGSDMLVEMLRGTIPEPVEQVGISTYAPKLARSDFNINWSGTAVDIDRLVRAGRAWTTFRGKRLIIGGGQVLQRNGEVPVGVLDGLCVQTGQGCFELQLVQPEGKGMQDAPAWARGARIEANERLGD